MRHVLLNTPLDTAWAMQLKRRGVAVVPTLVLMENISTGTAKSAAAAAATHDHDYSHDHVRGVRQQIDFKHSLEPVRILRNAGVRLLAGSDANTHLMMAVGRSTSIVRELQPRVSADMDYNEVPRSAASLQTVYWYL